MKKTPSDMIAGTIHETNSNGNLEIVEYKSQKSVLVEFTDTKCRIHTYASQIRSGSVKDKMKPSVHGVGYFGEGKYIASKSGSRTSQYGTWVNMISRCYSGRFPTYDDCSVHPDWHDFQVFAKWYDENHPNDGCDYDLDKDIKVHGNRVYSADTCLFVTPFENMASVRSRFGVFISPDGEVVNVYNFAEFGRDNNLDPSGLSRVQHGKLNHHRGWRKAP